MRRLNPLKGKLNFNRTGAARACASRLRTALALFALKLIWNATRPGRTPRRPLFLSRALALWESGIAETIAPTLALVFCNRFR